MSDKVLTSPHPSYWIDNFRPFPFSSVQPTPQLSLFGVVVLSSVRYSFPCRNRALYLKIKLNDIFFSPPVELTVPKFPTSPEFFSKKRDPVSFIHLLKFRAQTSILVICHTVVHPQFGTRYLLILMENRSVHVYL